MIKKGDLLLEIGAEELPAKSLGMLISALSQGLEKQLRDAGFEYSDVRRYATPRRLAIWIQQLQAMQPSRTVERKGPPWSAAFDAQGHPTKVGEGFARSCGVAIDQLQRQETPQGVWVVYRYEDPGKPLSELLPSMIQEAVAGIPAMQMMRWGAHNEFFIRPVHWAVLVYDGKLIHADILGVTTGNVTHGHRVYHPEPLRLSQAADYESLLYTKGKVIADCYARREYIRQQVIAVAAEWQGHVVIDEMLLEEVTGLVEWPVALLASFEHRFLEIPKDVLVSVMQHHQKCFPVTDGRGNLLPHFVTVSNIESQDVRQVIVGNERVMRARLSDAAFFYQTDRKNLLTHYLVGLKEMVFQRQLGSLYDKSQRIATLAQRIAESFPTISIDPEEAKRAGVLCKADLLTAMVGEFPELQGIMGYYYALAEGENEAVALAIRDHYLPRSATDELPETLLGAVLALADRLDTLVGLFGIHQPPTSEKDPFALRRAALGVLRILIYKKLGLNLRTLLEFTIENYARDLPNAQLLDQVHDFIIERLRAWYQEQGITSDTFDAVLAREKSVPLDIDYRVRAVQTFRQLSEGAALAAADKRVKNILVKSANLHALEVQNPRELVNNIDLTLLELPAEKYLYQELAKKTAGHDKKLLEDDYTERLLELASLREPVDDFFDTVMVMVDDEKVRNNRLTLLTALHQLFLEIADISLLQEKSSEVSYS